jgi:hypothetical protein
LVVGLEADETGGMKPPRDPHYRHRFPAEIISHAVWLYHVFSLSLRDVELILAQRGIVVSYETVRRWCKKFGATFAGRLRRRRPRPRPGDKWYMDEVFIRIQGVQHYLWRAVDQDGVVLDILVQARRDVTAGFKSSRQAQDFLSAHAFIYDHFHPRRHRLAAGAYRAIRSDEFRIWHQETRAQHAA